MRRVRRAVLPAFFYVLLIFAVSSIPSLRAPGPDFISKDKLAHVIEYFILGALLFRGVGWTVSRSRLATFGFILAVSASVGALDEIYQGFIPGRYMSAADWWADVLGAAMGAGLFIFTGLGNRWPAGRAATGRDEGDPA